MIHLDTSVALAELFAEDRRPPEALWREPLVSSRLLEYELLTRVHARSAARTHAEAVREVLAGVSLVDGAHRAGAGARAFPPRPVRMLDALHLATAQFLVAQRQKLALATYDERMRACAEQMGIELAEV